MSRKARLSRTDWLLGGFAALSDSGPSALKAEALARRLDTTKGSFYWHFEDVPDFHDALLDVWEAEALQALTRVLEEETGASARLRKLSQQITEYESAALANTSPEHDVRAWAKTDPRAAARVAKVDDLRLNLLTALLKDHGITNPDWARVMLGASVGLKDLPENDDSQPMNSLVDLVLALR